MIAWNLLSNNQSTIVIESGDTMIRMPIGSAYNSPAVGAGVFTCCSQFKNHLIKDEKTGEETKIPCDKDKIAKVLIKLVERATDACNMVGDFSSYRLQKALWRFPCRGLKVESELFSKQPTNWDDFCAFYNLDARQGVNLSDYYMKQKNCLPPLIYAVCSLNVGMVKYILCEKKANVNQKIKYGDFQGFNLRGYTALAFAAHACTKDTPKESAEIFQLEKFKIEKIEKGRQKN